VSLRRSLTFIALTVPGLAMSEPPGSADADTLAAMSFEDLMQARIETVVGASKYEQKVTRAPSSVNAR
jgi:hypothetical protein